MKVRSKSSGGKSQLVHSLNGSSLALPRIVAALLENNQTAEGIKIPQQVVKYFGKELIN
jgi:seryl-tRNA synthetase